MFAKRVDLIFALQGEFKRRVRRWQSPHAEIAIPACGVCNLRVSS